MKKIFITLFFVLACTSSFAQKYGLIMPSSDDEADEKAILEMRKRMEEIRKTEKRPTVGLVLEGGGAKGTCHVGALRYLEEIGVPIDLITGTSMGGLMGGLYALGYTAVELDSIMRSINWEMMMSDRVPINMYSYDKRRDMERYIVSIPFGRSRDLTKSFANKLPDGYLQGFNVNNMIRSLSVGYQDEMDFSDLPVPYFCVATEMLQMKEKNWTHGVLPDAMRSTMSIPFYFKPVRGDKSLFIDGGTSNNFPVDLAKAMGADLIIGININHQDRPTDMNIGQIALESITGMGRKAKEENTRAADVLIQPDLSGAGMLSFSAEAIATLLDNGYKAALEQKDKLESIVALTGRGGKKLHHRKATNISETPVLIDGIEIRGIPDNEAKYFNDKIKIEPGRKYSSEDIEYINSDILSTGAFESVKYRLLGTEEPYRLVFECEKGPKNIHSLGLRVDTEELISGIVNFGFNKGTLMGWRSDVTLRIGMNTYLNADLGYLPSKGPMIGMSAKVQYTTIPKLRSINYDDLGISKFWHNNLTIYLKDYKWSRIDITGGLQLDHEPWREDLMSDGSCTYKYMNQYFINAFAKIHYNSLNDGYFPTKGIKVSAEYEHLLTGLYENERVKNIAYLSGSLEVPVSIGKRFTMIPSLYFHGVIGGSNPNLANIVAVGGTMYGRYFENQIPFEGFYGVNMCDNFTYCFNLQLRGKISKKSYLSFKGGIFNTEDELHDIFSKRVFSYGLQFDYNIITGPLRAGIYMNSYDKKINAYLGVGFNF